MIEKHISERILLSGGAACSSPLMLLLLLLTVAHAAFAQAFPANFNVRDMAESDGFRIVETNGFPLRDPFGELVGSAGDVNGDGVEDLLVDAPFASPNGEINAGSVYVVFGRVGGYSSLALDEIAGAIGFRIDGAVKGSRLGLALSRAGDVNGDEIDDLILGSPDGPGSAYVIFGRRGGFPPSMSVASLNGSNGFRIYATPESGVSGGFSSSVAGGYDVNGDGIDDLIIGAPFANPSGLFIAGSTFVVFGRRTPFGASLDVVTLDGTNGFRLDGAEPGDIAGFATSGAGDVNGDGIGDIAVATRYAPPGGFGFPSTGRIYVVFGRRGPVEATMVLARFDGNTGFRIDGIPFVSSYFQFFRVFDSAGDVNADGIDDLIVGGMMADSRSSNGRGSAFLVFGSHVPLSPVIDLTDLGVLEGVRINGAAEGDVAGATVSAAGDVNGDGIDDVLIGAPGVDGIGPSSEDLGSAYVLFGRVGGFPSTVSLASIDGSNGFRVDGAAERGQLGHSVNPAGDFNDDGVADVAVADAYGSNGGSTVYVVYGREVLFVDDFE